MQAVAASMAQLPGLVKPLQPGPAPDRGGDGDHDRQGPPPTPSAWPAPVQNVAASVM